MKFQNLNYTIDCGTADIPPSGNGYAIKIKFNKLFPKPPIIAIGGSVGITSSGYIEGANIIEVTTSNFVYQSQWERGIAFTLHWIAIAL